MRCKSSAGFGKSECKALFIENIMFSFACAPAHAHPALPCVYYNESVAGKSLILHPNC